MQPRVILAAWKERGAVHGTQGEAKRGPYVMSRLAMSRLVIVRKSAGRCPHRSGAEEGPAEAGWERPAASKERGAVPPLPGDCEIMVLRYCCYYYYQHHYPYYY